ncbi:MAG: HPP family protein, partial [Mycobacteriales bacterium]
LWPALLAPLRAAAAPAPPGSESRRPTPGSLTAQIEARLGSLGTGLVGLVCCGLTLAAAGALAWDTDQPWVFPSLAPTVLLVFETPLRPQASPRHTVLGHAAGILIGYGSLAAFGLVHSPAATTTGFTPARIGVVALAVAVTTFVLHASAVRTRRPRPARSSSAWASCAPRSNSRSCSARSC